MKLSQLFAFGLSCEAEEVVQGPNEECTSAEIGATCHSVCDYQFDECLHGCNHDLTCFDACIETDAKCTNMCPCYANCWEGCPCEQHSQWCPNETCQNANEIPFKYCVHETEELFVQCTFSCDVFDLVCHQQCAGDYSANLQKCPCGAQCPDGCPCEHWNCHAEEPPAAHDDIHLLMLNPSDTSTPNWLNMRVTLLDNDLDGLIEDKKELQINRHELFQQKRSNMCGFKLQGKMYLAGSGDGNEGQKTRLGRIDGNEIVYLTTLKDQKWPFKFGICTGDVGGTHAVLCAPYDDRKHCLLWDGNKGWTKTQMNKDVHFKGGLAKWDNNDGTVAIVFSGREDKHGITERLKHNTRSSKWEWKKDGKEFKEFKTFHYFSTVTFNNFVYMFGGQPGTEGKIQNKVFRYDGSWHKAEVETLIRTLL